MISKSELLKKIGFDRISVGEYQANLNGLNMFFGAVLGLALTGTETLNSWQFAIVLAFLASIVISILYISSSRNRLAYSVYAILAPLMFPQAMDFLLKGQGVVPDKIRPTLIVWALMTIAIEFWARDNEQAQA